ncbi:hypothetical protein [Patiriisocius hiemis]|uniref:Outer membrane protein beta-barrel domain-containing protein n=1 Tax=Patiriisocius hiemis TaxID=3075604 RepID=A0ABU2YC60_9FLAO|nr:hypothetical protein [Constantimarinum sp. W242]MDT0555773.1 hypothetical protein [Constantimarinum sp. W242]
MKTFILHAALAVATLTMSIAYGQETKEKTQIEILKETKQQIITEEKAALKKAVEQINSKLENNEISSTEADNLKNEAAQKHALNIENRLAIIDNKIALLERNGTDNNTQVGAKVELFADGDNEEADSFFGVRVTNNDSDDRRKYDRRTKSLFVFSFGLNNVLIDGQSLDDSPYKVGGSRYAELGLAWSTRVFKESNWLRFKYGFSFQFNGLKPTDNRVFVDTGDQTELQTFPVDLDKSKFRMDNLVFPVHFEFGPSKKIEGKNYFRYSTHDKFKFGIGGYAGFNLGTRQKLKFEENNEDVKQKLKANYNTNNFIYGLSGYIGYSDISLYVKYDLNTIFKNNPVKQRNISLGVRWDWD